MLNSKKSAMHCTNTTCCCSEIAAFLQSSSTRWRRRSIRRALQGKYAPHPYTWMAPARAKSTGLGLESEGREMPLSELPPWEESRCKLYPVLWKNPPTGELAFQVHPCGAAELLIDALPEGAKRDGALFPDGAHLTELTEVHNLLYRMQRPGISPSSVYPHDWQENDLVLFHNRGILHTVVGAFAPDAVRAFHQCNLAASEFSSHNF
ncbi:hypothetical protein DFH09DRAFT_1178085 [Mycena vulgaris]|nr:hypothetical protein DFH09DRAFT_1178085 [Mycena vulgaris]